MIPFWIDGDELLEIYEAIWTKIKDLQNIEFKAFVVYNDRYIKTKIRTDGNKVYISFRNSNVRENGVECESVTTISADFLLFYEKEYYLEAYLDNCIFKIINKQVDQISMIIFLILMRIILINDIL